MFTYNTFMPTQGQQNQQSQPQQLPNSSPVRTSSSRPLQNNSPAYVPDWDNQPIGVPTQRTLSEPFQSQKRPSQDPFAIPNSIFAQQENHEHEDIPYNIKILLEAEDKGDKDDKDNSSTSSDSEETDTMPSVFPNKWTFDPQAALRRNSEPFPSGIIPGQKPATTPQNSTNMHPKTWGALPAEKVTIKPATFMPLSTMGFSPMEKRAYFVTLQGFNMSNGKRIFRLDRLCSALPPRTPDESSFLYIDLWNDLQNRVSKDLDNIFEPSCYSIPCLYFKLVITVNMSHAYEDPYHIEFTVDLRQQAFSMRDWKSQGLEISYADPVGHGSDKGVSGNSITLHVHLAQDAQQNPSQMLFNAFPKQHTPVKNPLSQDAADFNVLLRQMFVRLPLRRVQAPQPQPHIPFIGAPQKIMSSNQQTNGKRGSAIILGQGQHTPIKGPNNFQGGSYSPASWTNFTPDHSPLLKNKNGGLNGQKEPELPPGILQQNGSTPLEQMQGGSLFKFRGQGQQRNSVQVIKGDNDDNNKKRTNRILSTDFSQLLGGDCSPIRVLETFVNAVKNGNRRQSQTSEGSWRFQMMDNDFNSQSQSTLNASSIGESMPDIVPEEDDETQPRTGSSINDEFKLEDYAGRMFEFAKTSGGCKALQKCVMNGGKEALDMIIAELGDRINELMLDQHANYLVQTLAQKGNPQQRLWLLQKMGPTFIDIAKDKKGTHSLQAIVSNFTSPEEFVAVRDIVGPYVFELSTDSRANYVIQKLINTIPVEAGQFLYQPLLDNFVQIANNSFGLLVLKQMMAKVEPSIALRQKVVEFACMNFEKLIQNPYGNYAIQYIIEFYPGESQMIMNKVLLKIIPYSSQKISSNVIEKCLLSCDSQFRKRIVDEILKNGRLGDLMKNKYGNFVTLQLLATSQTDDQQRLMHEIMRCALSFNGTKYKTRWQKFVQDNPMKIPMNGEQMGSEVQVNVEASQGQGFNSHTLESVKQIWREMTKEEKNESPNPSPYQYGKKKNYGKRQSFC